VDGEKQKSKKKSRPDPGVEGQELDRHGFLFGLRERAAFELDNQGEKEGGGKDQENGKEIEEVDQQKLILKTVYEDLSSLVGALGHLPFLFRPGEVLLILEADDTMIR
jgi:hypothetical protein